MRPPDFGQGDAYTNALHVKCVKWSFFSCFLKNFLARYARSTAFYKVSVIEIRNLGMQHYLYVQLYFSAVVDSQLPKCTKTHVKLHKSAHKMSTNCLWLGDPQTLQLTENWIRCTHPECGVGRHSALDSLGVFTAFPMAPCSSVLR